MSIQKVGNQRADSTHNYGQFNYTLKAGEELVLCFSDYLYLTLRDLHVKMIPLDGLKPSMLLQMPKIKMNGHHSQPIELDRGCPAAKGMMNATMVPK